MTINTARLVEHATCVLPNENREELAATLSLIRREDILDPAPETTALAMQATALLPSQTMHKLQQLRYGIGTDLGIVLLRNTPLDADIPSHPKPTRHWHEKRSSISEGTHLVVHAAVGTVPVSYESENDGDTVATLSPKPGSEHRQESSSSQTLLELHGEDQAHLYPPDILIISNLQEDGQTAVGTIIASNRLAVPRLSAADVEIGMRAIFTINPPSSFGTLKADVGQPRLMSMFYGSFDDLMLNFDAHAMRSIEPEGEQLIAKMKDVLLEVSVVVTLRRGDLLVIDNRIVAHGRTSFRADYEHPRITQRSFGRFDFAATRAVRRRGSTVMSWAG